MCKTFTGIKNECNLMLEKKGKKLAPAQDRTSNKLVMLFGQHYTNLATEALAERPIQFGHAICSVYRLLLASWLIYND